MLTGLSSPKCWHCDKIVAEGNMPFRCPQCHQPDSLQITDSIDLSPDRHQDEIVLQVVGCSACNFRGLAVYAESRHASLDRDDFEHTGYWVSPDAISNILTAINACPEPRNPHCKCAVHTRLGEKDVYGTWSGLLELKQAHTFSMRLYLG
jgi:hypothetical protein